MTTQKELTGRKVFAIFATGFGIIISVNVTMAYSAISTFPGLVVKNGYIASQTFDEERSAQKALGLQFQAGYVPGRVSLDIKSLAAIPQEITQIEAFIGRPTHDRDDQVLTLTRTNGIFVAPVRLEPGAWVVKVSGAVADGTKFRHDMGVSVRR